MSARNFSAVYDEHIWHVYGFFAYRLRARADVEDLTQLTFERALRAWGRYDPSRAGVLTWLLVIARNLLVDHMRADRTALQRPVSDIEDDTVFAVADHHDLGPDPELQNALEELGDRERELIALRFGGDLSGPEIAELTGLTLANVQQILSRSLRRLRTSIELSRASARPAPVGPSYEQAVSDGG